MSNSEDICKFDEFDKIEDIEDSVCQIESSESDTTQILSFNIPTKNVTNAKCVACVGAALFIVGVPMALIGVNPTKIISSISSMI